MVKNGKNCVHVVFQCPLAWSFICMAFVEFAPTGVINFFMVKTNKNFSSSNSIVYIVMSVPMWNFKDGGS